MEFYISIVWDSYAFGQVFVEGMVAVVDVLLDDLMFKGACFVLFY